MIILLAVAALGSFAFSFIQGWIQLHLGWFLVILGGGIAIFAYIYRKETKVATLTEMTTESLRIGSKISKRPVSIRRVLKMKDYGKFSNTGKIWIGMLRGNPTKPAVLFDEKGNGIGYDVDIADDDSPVREILRPREVTIQFPTRKSGKRKVKYEETREPDRV